MEADLEGVPFELFGLLDGYSDYEMSSLPEGFAEEALGPADLACTGCCCAEGVVGMLCEGDASTVLDKAVAVLEGRGWRVADEGGGLDGASLIKDEGRYRWAYLASSQVSDSVSLWIAYSVEGG